MQRQLVDNQRREADLRQKLTALRRTVAIQNMKNDGDLSTDEIVAFIEAFGVKAEPFVRGAAFRIQMPKARGDHDLVVLALAAVNQMQIECFQDGGINGKFGLMWIYKHGRKMMCADGSPASEAAAVGAEADAKTQATNAKAEAGVWPKELCIAMQRHMRLVECLVKLGHASLMEQTQTQQAAQLRVQQLRISVAQQKLKVAQLHKLALLEMRGKMEMKEKMKARICAAGAEAGRTTTAPSVSDEPAAKQDGGSEPSSAGALVTPDTDTVKGRLEAQLKGKDGPASMAVLLTKLAACKTIVAGMTGLDAAAQAKYLGSLTPAQKAAMDELAVIQELLVL